MVLHSPEWVEEHVGSFDSLIHMRFPKVPELYDYTYKNNVREKMVRQAQAYLIDPDTGEPINSVRMLFMPSVCAVCLYYFAKEFNINSRESLAVEHNHRYAGYLLSWKQAAEKNKLAGGKPFKGLAIFEGKVSEATAQCNGPFEIANLDFNGPWNREVLETLRNLFSRNLLTIPAVLFLTLNDSERWRQSSRSLKQLLPGRVYDSTNNTNYTAHRLWHMDWIAEGSAKMITMAFGIHKKEPKFA